MNLTAPANGAGFAAPATINLTASVATNGHSITGVQFYNGSTLLGQSTTAPYSFAWTNLPAGTYTVYALVTYDAGGIQSSAPAIVTVNLVPVAPATITPVALSGNLISVSWPAPNLATGYILSRNGTAIASLAATNYLDLGLSPSTLYAYSVMATSAYGNSPPSVTNSATTLGSGTARWWDAGGSTTGPQDGNGNWGGSANTWWNGSANVMWTDYSPVIFGNGATTNCAVLLTNNVTPGNMLFNANNGGTYNFSSSGGSLLILSGTPTITCNDSETLSATLNGGGFIKTGPGTLTVTGENTNTGAITVSGGRLVATSGGWYANRSIGSGSLTVGSGAVAEFSVAHGFGYGSGGEPATLNGGTLQFDHENYVSSLTMTAGTVSGAGEIRTTGGTYSTLASANPSGISLNVNFVSAGTFSVARGTGAVDLLASGPASDSGNFTKSGSGIMAISGAWANTGTTTISAGTLQVDGSLGTNTVTVANNATLEGVGVVNGATTVQSGGTLAPGDVGIGTLSFAASLTLNSGSKTVLELSKNGSVPANDLVSVTGTLALGGTLTVNNVGTNALALGDSFHLFNAGTYSGNFTSLNLPSLGGGLAWDTNSLTVNGIISVVVSANSACIWSGAVNGLWDVGATANWTVGGAGTVFTNNANAQFDDTAAGTTAVTLNTGVSVASLTFANSAKNYSIAGTGSIGGAATMVKGGAGTLTLATTNTYTGSTLVNSGMLQVNGSLPSGAVTVATNAVLSGTGMIYGPTTTQAGGILQPGLGGTNLATLTISNSLNLSGNVVFTLNRTNAQSASKLAGLKTVAYGGMLTVTNIGPVNFAVGDTFTLFQATNYSGSFANLVLPTLAANLAWNTSGLSNGVIAVVSPPVQLVQNGGFEAGSFTNWTQSGGSGAVVTASTYVHSGTYGAELGPTSMGYLSQTLATVPGQAYVLSFWLMDDTPGSTEILQVNWNSATVYALTNPAAAFGWSNLTAIVTATNTSMVLQFGFENDPGYFGLDDISVTATNDTLTYLAGANGVISGATPQIVSYNASGTAVTAVPNLGYHFVNWSDASVANPRADASVKSNLTVTAIFAINTYTLAYLAGTNGTISGANPQTVNYGASGVPVSAVPNPGYAFANWSDGLASATRTDANVTSNLTVTASFVALVTTLPAILPGMSFSGESGFSLTATGAVGGTCVLFCATNLSPPIVWQPVQTNTGGTNGVYNFSDPQATNFSQRFYHLLGQ